MSDQNTAKFKNALMRDLLPAVVVPDRSAGPPFPAEICINPRFQFQLAKAGQPIQTSKEIVELNYVFQLIPSLFFRPGIQYDIRPGGTSTHPNTWVFAFHIQLTL